MESPLKYQVGARPHRTARPFRNDFCPSHSITQSGSTRRRAQYVRLWVHRPKLVESALATLPSARPSPARHRPRYRDIARYSPACYGRVAAERLEGSSCDGRSATPWCGAAYASRMRRHQGRSRSPKRAQFGRTGVSINVGPKSGHRLTGRVSGWPSLPPGTFPAASPTSSRCAC